MSVQSGPENMSSMPSVQAMGISIVAFFSRLIPLLIGWIGAMDPATRQSALEYLLAVVRVAWPRLRHHATLLWTYVEGVSADSKLGSDTDREARDMLREACSVPKQQGQR